MDTIDALDSSNVVSMLPAVSSFISCLAGGVSMPPMNARISIIALSASGTDAGFSFFDFDVVGTLALDLPLLLAPFFSDLGAISTE